MSKFKAKKAKSIPTISTASLPDIVFILLFFFMVVTVMRPHDMMVDFTTPQATELVKLENKSWIHTIYVGKPIFGLRDKLGTAPRIQLDDKISELSEIAMFVEDKRVPVSQKMGLITDIKQELRKINQRKVNYSSTPRGDGFDK